jgi:hypothetical protein
MPRKKKTAVENGKMSKTDFVKSQPADMPAKDVVAKAKAAGMTLSENYVYTIRSAAKTKPGKRRRPKGSANTPTGAMAAKVAASGVEDLLRAAASEIGLSRAIAILQEQQAVLRAALGR